MEEGEEEGEEEEIPNRREPNSPLRSAFNCVLDQIRINRAIWSDEETESLMNTLLEGFTEEDERSVGVATSVEPETH